MPRREKKTRWCALNGTTERAYYFENVRVSPNEIEQVEEVRHWLRYAREDLIAAETMSGQQEIVPRHVCWLAQQAAEKALKAVLVFLQIDFPRSHDLDALRNLIAVGWQVREDHPDLADLTEWAVESRYPGDWPDATETDAK